MAKIAQIFESNIALKSQGTGQKVGIEHSNVGDGDQIGGHVGQNLSRIVIDAPGNTPNQSTTTRHDDVTDHKVL